MSNTQAKGSRSNESFVLTGRTICAGQAEGEALVTRMPVAWFNTAFEDATGIIRKDGHELEGQSVKGKIFVFDTDIGSTGGSLGIYNKVKMGTGPLGIIYREAHGISASGAIFADLPAMDRIREGIPWKLIETGDWIKMDATNGRIEITKRANR